MSYVACDRKDCIYNDCDDGCKDIPVLSGVDYGTDRTVECETYKKREEEEDD